MLNGLPVPGPALLQDSRNGIPADIRCPSNSVKFSEQITPMPKGKSLVIYSDMGRFVAGSGGDHA